MQILAIETLVITFNIIGGLALFMYAITLLRENLNKVSGSKVAELLEKVSDKPLKGMAVGTGVTMMTQSSSITALTLIGFVNAGIMSFSQSVNIMLGSEIGTTLTMQLVAFEVGLAYWPLIAIGFFVKMFMKNEKAKLVGNLTFSLGLIFMAMDFIKQGAVPLGQSPIFVDLIIQFGAFPLFGILIGTLISGVTQSSSATTGLVVAFAMAGVIDLGAGIGIILGANIGTCFLELAAGVGATTPAKRTAVAQALINVIGVVVFFPFLGQFAGLVQLTSPDLPRQLANAHTIFNVLVSFLLVPFVGLLVRFVEKIIPDKEGEILIKHFIDHNMLKFPQIALKEAENEIIKAAELTTQMINLSKKGLVELDKKAAKKVLYLEDEIDEICRTCEKFIDKIHEEELNEHQKLWRMKLLTIITDIERVGDLTNNIGEFALEINGKISMSEEAKKELIQIFDLVEKTYTKAIDALKTKDKVLAKIAVDLEDKVDKLENKLKNNHYKRLKKGICKPEAEMVFIETLRNLERIGDHADNIAYDVITSH
ncbi:MAG: Na/Pi cotransporter family protein [Candidatus Ranarchaeia archaeon]